MLDLNALFIAANNQQRRMFRIAVVRDSMLLNNAEFENGALHFRGFGRKCSVYLSADAIPEIVVEGVPTYGRKLASFKADFENRRYDYLEAIAKTEDVKEQIVNIADRYAGGVANFDKESDYVEFAKPLAFEVLMKCDEQILVAEIEEALRAKFRTFHAVDSNVEEECDLSSKEEVEAEIEKLNDFAEKCSNGRAEPTEESHEVEAGRAPIPQTIEERVERNEKIEEQIELAKGDTMFNVKFFTQTPCSLVELKKEFTNWNEALMRHPPRWHRANRFDDCVFAGGASDPEWRSKVDTSFAIVKAINRIFFACEKGDCDCSVFLQARPASQWACFLKPLAEAYLFECNKSTRHKKIIEGQKAFSSKIKPA